MIDGTEKPWIPLKFAIRAARYNEFRCQVTQYNNFFSWASKFVIDVRNDDNFLFKFSFSYANKNKNTTFYNDITSNNVAVCFNNNEVYNDISLDNTQAT